MLEVYKKYKQSIITVLALDKQWKQSGLIVSPVPWSP